MMVRQPVVEVVVVGGYRGGWGCPIYARPYWARPYWARPRMYYSRWWWDPPPPPAYYRCRPWWAAPPLEAPPPPQHPKDRWREGPPPNPTERWHVVLFDASGCGMTSRLHKVNAQSVFSSQVPLHKVTVDFRLWAAPLQDLTSKSPTNAPPPECPPPPRRHDGTSSWNFETQLPMAFASPLGPRSFGEVAAAIVLYNAADCTSYTTAMACVKAARDAAGVDGDEICTVVVGIEASVASADPVTYQEGRAFAEDQGVGLFFETALATSADDTRLLVSVGEHLYARAVSRREKEQAKEQALMMLADAMEVGWFERVELEKLEEALEAAIMAGVDEDALKPAQEKLAELKAPPWYSCTHTR